MLVENLKFIHIRFSGLFSFWNNTLILETQHDEYLTFLF